MLGTPEELGPVFTREPGEAPYPEVMNAGAIAEIDALDPDAVVVKGDLTDLGTEEEYERSCDAYTRLGARMHHVRGNHDAMITDRSRAGHVRRRARRRHARGARHRAARHRARPHSAPTSSSGSTTLAASATTPVLVFGHHHPWDPELARAQRPLLRHQPRRQRGAVRGDRRGAKRSRGYFAGHTHRNRVRRFAAGAQRADRRGRVREGLSGRVGRVPDPRRRLHAARAPHRRPGRDGVDREDAPHVRRPVSRLRARARSRDRCFTQAF